QKNDRPKTSSGDRNGLQNDMTPGLAEGKFRPPETRTEIIEQVQQAEEQMELLQAQLVIKEAQLRVAQTAVEGAKAKADLARHLFNSGTMPEGDRLKANETLRTAEADLIVKQAELKEPQIRLRQAERRLAKLKERLKPAQGEKLAKGHVQSLFKEFTIDFGTL